MSWIRCVRMYQILSDGVKLVLDVKGNVKIKHRRVLNNFVWHLKFINFYLLHWIGNHLWLWIKYARFECWQENKKQVVCFYQCRILRSLLWLIDCKDLGRTSEALNETKCIWYLSEIHYFLNPDFVKLGLKQLSTLESIFTLCLL